MKINRTVFRLLLAAILLAAGTVQLQARPGDKLMNRP